MEIAVAQIHSKLMGNRTSTCGHLGKDSPRYLRNLTNSTDIFDTIECIENEEPIVCAPSHNLSVRSTDDSGGNRLAVHSTENYESDSKENRICNTVEKVEDIHEDDFRETAPECLPENTSELPGSSTEQFVDQCVGNVTTSEPSQTDIRKSLKRLIVPALYSDRDLREVCKKLKLKLSKPPCQKYLKNYVHEANGPELHSAKKRRKHPDSDDDSTDDDSEYEVEAIRDYSFEKGEHWYLVKWKNWPEETNTWEPKRNLKGSSEMLKEYHEELKRKRVAVVVDEDSPKSKRRRIDSCILKVCSKSSEDLATLLKLGGIAPSKFKFKKSNIIKLKREVKQMYITASETTRRKNLNKLFESESNLFGEDGLLGFAEKRIALLCALKDWEGELNNHYYNNFRIVVENHVDLEGPPENFTYITNYIPGEGITIPEDPLVGCCCGDCFANKDECCAAGAGVDYAYDENGLVRVESGSPIYECNKLCACGPDCPNRVVQKGQKIDVLIFRTDDGRGWGVKTLENIRKGTFVMEYNGEVITNEEAERRGTLYDGEGRTYLFDLDYDESDPLTVDAAFYGNAAHFINHSCDPNLYVYGVWIEHLDTRIPRVAFFARRNIKKYEELTFDYRMTAGGSQTPKKTTVNGSPSKEFTITNEDYLRSASSSSRRKPIACRCGTAKCRKFLF